MVDSMYCEAQRVLIDPDDFVENLAAQEQANSRVAAGITESIEILTTLMKLEKITPDYLQAYAKLVTKLELLRMTVQVSGVITGAMLKEFMPDKEEDG